MKRLFFIFGLLLSCVGIIFSIYISFNNPDMTKTRLFITYWPQILITSIITFVGINILLRGD